MTNLANEQRIAYKLNEAKAWNIFHNLQFTTENTNLFESQTIDLNCLSFNIQFLYIYMQLLEPSMCPLTPIVCHYPLFFQLKSIANYESKQNWPTTKRTTIRGAQIRKLQSITIVWMILFFFFSFLISCMCRKMVFNGGKCKSILIQYSKCAVCFEIKQLHIFNHVFPFNNWNVFYCSDTAADHSFSNDWSAQIKTNSRAHSMCVFVRTFCAN